MFKKKKFKKVSHSKSTMGPIMSMEMALAEASIKLSRIMEWVYELNFFLKLTLHIIANSAKTFF